MNLNQEISDCISFCIFESLSLCFPLQCFHKRLWLWQEIWGVLLLEMAEIRSWGRKDYVFAEGLLLDLAVLSSKQGKKTFNLLLEADEGCLLLGSGTEQEEWGKPGFTSKH